MPYDVTLLADCDAANKIIYKALDRVLEFQDTSGKTQISYFEDGGLYVFRHCLERDKPIRCYMSIPTLIRAIEELAPDKFTKETGEVPFSIEFQGTKNEIASPTMLAMGEPFEAAPMPASLESFIAETGFSLADFHHETFLSYINAYLTYQPTEAYEEILVHLGTSTETMVTLVACLETIAGAVEDAIDNEGKTNG